MDPIHSLNFSASSSSIPLGQLHPYLHVPPPTIFAHRAQPPIEFGVGNVTSREELMELRKHHLRLFWQQQMFEISQISEFKQHQLPLARIKRIMKSDEEVKMISADAPVLFSKACELFILELTLRSWLHTEENKRRTLQRSDIAQAIGDREVLEFLVDLVPSLPRQQEAERGGHGSAAQWVNFEQETSRRNQEAPPQFVFQAQPMPGSHMFYEGQ